MYVSNHFNHCIILFAPCGSLIGNKKFLFLVRKIKSGFESNENVQKFRYGNKSKHDNLNDLMWDWFRQAHDKAIPLSGPIL